VSVIHACNPSYSGGRDQEDCGLKSAKQIVRETLYRKKSITKKEGRGESGEVAQGEGPEFKP
jgi:hypothetical protein